MKSPLSVQIKNPCNRGFFSTVTCFSCLHFGGLSDQLVWIKYIVNSCNGFWREKNLSIKTAKNAGSTNMKIKIYALFAFYVVNFHDMRRKFLEFH